MIVPRGLSRAWASLQGNGRFVDGAKDYDIEETGGSKCLDAGWPDFGGERQSADDFTQER